MNSMKISPPQVSLLIYSLCAALDKSDHKTKLRFQFSMKAGGLFAGLKLALCQYEGGDNFKISTKLRSVKAHLEALRYIKMFQLQRGDITIKAKHKIRPLA